MEIKSSSRMLSFVPRMFLFASAGLLAQGACADVPWFDGEVEYLEYWPTDGSDWNVPGAGVWRGTGAAELYGEAGARHLSLASFDMPLSLELSYARDAQAADVTLSTSLAVFDSDSLFEPDQTAKGGVTLSSAGDGTLRYYGLVKDPHGATNIWAALSGAEPKVGEEVRIDMTLSYSGEGLGSVSYAVDGMVLTTQAYGAESPIVLPGGLHQVSGVSFLGSGEIHSVSGHVAGDPVCAALTIPQLDGMSVTGVKAGGIALSPEADGTYSVPSGAVVTVSLAAETGKFLSSPAAVFEMGGVAMELPAAALPEIVEAGDILRVNEIMASNGSSLATLSGKRELDWVEIRNLADFQVDLSGWYLYDDPSKKPSKWERINGPCVIPPGGYRIVWADKSYEGFTEAEAYSRIGLSSSGETVFLADPNGTIVHSCDFGMALEDVSQGLPAESGGSGAILYFKTPTPGRANSSAAFTAPTPQVEFSVPHGWKTEPFEVELSCPDDPGAEIRYTTDGTSPGADSPLYVGPIAVSSTTVLRAGVPNAGAVLQRDASATYLFVDDVLAQGSSVPPGFPADRAVNNHAMAYGLDAAIVDGCRERILRGFTNSVSTISLVVDPRNLFDADTGIYTHPGKDGIEWERELMVEMFSPTGAEAGFSVPAGIRIRGAYSRNANCPKHSFRLFFRSDYGMQKLAYPLFGDEGAGEFKKIDLRTSQNFSWAWHNNANETFIHEVFPRDTQRDMGQPYTRSRYYNLFINGQYWGMYQTEERVDEHYAETYLGGDKSSYDVVRTSQPGYETGVVEGTEAAWRSLWDIAVNEGFGSSHPDNYRRVLGLNPDGSRNTGYPVYVHPESLATYMLTAHYAADTDSPASASIANNVCGVRNRDDGTGAADGWIFCRHDAEHALGLGDVLDTTLFGTDGHKNGANFLLYKNFGPAELNYRLLADAEYRMAFADIVYRACLRPGGALTPDIAEARFRARMSEIDDAIACESARWGHGTKTRDTWLAACENRIAFIRDRVPVLIGQYRSRGWYPQVDAPYVSRADGARLADGDVLAAGERARIASVAEGGTAYFTTDGSDPRSEGGAVAPSAAPYSDAEGIAIASASAKIRVRVRASDGEWSALEEVALASEVPSDQCLGVRVAAVYSSTADGGGDGSEFIVLTNLLDRAVALDGLRVACAKKGGLANPSLDLVLGLGDELAANGTLELAKADRWPGIDGATGKPLQKITNGEVDMKVWDSGGQEVQNIFFSAAWWPVGQNAKGKDVGSCDETGAHFVAFEFGRDVTEQTQWRPSFVPPAYGTPGYGAVAAAAADNGVREWLNGLAATEEGQFAITNFSGSADALVTCYLVDIAPDPDPDIAVEIPSVSIDPSGRPVLGAALLLGGKGSARTVNGAVRLYHAQTVEALGSSEEYLELGSEFPVQPAPREVPKTPSRFFRVKLEVNN